MIATVLSMTIAESARAHSGASGSGRCRQRPPSSQSQEPPVGRPGGNRTPNPRFWRPVLCQLSYWPATPRLYFVSRCARVLPAERTVLLHLQPLGRLLLVLRRRVVAALALGAGQGDDVALAAPSLRSHQGRMGQLTPPSLFPALLENLGHRAGADRAAALADGEAHPLLHRDRRDQLRSDQLMLSPGITISTPSGKCIDARHVRRPEVELRTVAR